MPQNIDNTDMMLLGRRARQQKSHPLLVAGVVMVALVVITVAGALVARAANLVLHHARLGNSTFAVRADPSGTPTPLPASPVGSGSGIHVGSTGWSLHPRSPANSPFATVCDVLLCVDGQPFNIHGATAYGTYADPATEISLAQAGKLNTLELVEFDTQYHDLTDTMSDATWGRVDRFVAAAGQAHMHVILNLSEYGQSLQAAGITPTTTDWKDYLSFIANRTNTVTGAQYRNDPTILMVELFGEICFPGEQDSTCPAGTSGTASQMLTFFQRSEREWHTLAPNILVSSGGLSHLDGHTNIPWQPIVADPANSVCDIEVNSPGDLSDSVAKVTSYCGRLGKPWFLAAWSSCFGSSTYPFSTPSDNAMAAHAADMYNLTRGHAPAAYVSAGTDFWNLRDEGTTPGTCSLSPRFPLTWATVQANAP